jgi:predicted nucleic acid-binding protein
LILISDANVLIDLGLVNGLAVLTQLAKVEVLDVIFDECTSPSQLQHQIISVGMQKIEVTQDWLRSATAYHQGSLSFQDALCLYYAKNFNRVLITNDKPLRTLSQQQGIEVHGTLWIIRQAYEQKILSSNEFYVNGYRL